MDNYKVSLVIPCYNIENITGNENSFDKTVESIKNQSIGFENIEVIFVDNGSIDNTKSILKEFCKDNENIKLYSIEKNSGGPSAPRNLGIDYSTADYVMFLDCDDTLTENAIEIMYNTITRYDLDLVKVNFNIVIDNVVHKNITVDKNIIAKPKSADLEYVSLYVWDGIYNKKFLNDNNIRFENVRAEDFLFIIDCICNSENDIHILNNVYGINYNSDNINSISHTCYDLENLKNHIEVCTECTEKLKNSNMALECLNAKTTSFKYSAMIYLFYSEDMQIRDEMFEELKKFLRNLEDYNFINLAEISSLHYIFWKLSNFLILHGFKNIFFFLLDILRSIKKNERH